MMNYLKRPKFDNLFNFYITLKTCFQLGVITYHVFIYLLPFGKDSILLYVQLRLIAIIINKHKMELILLH